ncbi:UPF0187-domain-containing protein [Trichodelitschia bisporula]|uniref:UPF0187-domain-containing protein n=1 Tax=Trichodelitschia bisporula TaxID=703511 RepID=A0A6G1HSE9_9PEZI|nr:UPF0187-domain-containing protein [Trichodelitschia bisporula]
MSPAYLDHDDPFSPRRRSTYPLYNTTTRKPRRWPLVLRITKGSVHALILPAVTFHALFTALIVYLDLYVQPLGLPGTIVPSISIVVGLMLVFRNGTSYDRFWSGRNHLTAITGSVRHLVRYILTYSRDLKTDEATPAERADTEAAVRLLIALPFAVKHSLRSEFGGACPPLPARSGMHTPTAAPAHTEAGLMAESLGTLRPEYSGLLPATLLSLEDRGVPLPVQLAAKIEAYVRRGWARGWWQAPQAGGLSGEVGAIVRAYGAMETIRTTPIPVAHLIHAKQVLALYLMVLPFAMVDEMAWWSVLVIVLIAFTLYGIEAIGSELEEPFGYDKNDIKMDAIVEDLKVECQVLLEEWSRGNGDYFD